MYVTYHIKLELEPPISNLDLPESGLIAWAVHEAGEASCFFSQITEAKVLQWPALIATAVAISHSRSQHLVNPWSPSRAGSRGELADNDLLAISPVPPLPLRKGSANSFPCRNSSCGSLTIPQLLGPNHQWDDPGNSMAKNRERKTGTLSSLHWARQTASWYLRSSAGPSSCVSTD